ncbi:MAG TPA: YjgN family protein [Casimicrobiaceae bacterium]|nr:YjgN family protein [Casimicrobiaceae bacterium]
MNDRDKTAIPPRPDYGRANNDDRGPWLAPAQPTQPRKLADELEPGRLREELGGAPSPPPAKVPERLSPFTFTGDGAEYFRIWIVNLFLTLVTLGIYSAWAKVRKTRYFWQNTQLQGRAFDYHGDARAILLGRIVALVLLAGYTFAFDISRNTGLVMLVVLCAVGPWLFMRAQRFKLVNTSWRGLRFGFDSPTSEAYQVVLPPLAIWFSSAAITAVASDRLGLLGAAGILSFAMIPWMHHRLKAYQHRRARFGARAFSFFSAASGFYAIYFKAMLLIGAASLVAFVGMFGFASAMSTINPILTLGVGFGVGFVGYLFAWPYFAARMQALVWSHTRLEDVRFSSAIAAGPLAKLTFRNVVLTIATLGLYWPFAAVALARYRVECMRTESDEPLTALAQATVAGPGLAAGDAALDAFGLDIGL